MAFTTDMTTDVGKVRLLITDLAPEQPIFPDDAHIEAFLALEDDVKTAAALALETIAANRVLVMQVIKLLDLDMDGAATAKALLAAAKQLRETAAMTGDWAGFDIAQMTDASDFTWREYMGKLLLANGSL